MLPARYIGAWRERERERERLGQNKENKMDRERKKSSVIKNLKTRLIVLVL